MQKRHAKMLRQVTNGVCRQRANWQIGVQIHAQSLILQAEIQCGAKQADKGHVYLKPRNTAVIAMELIGAAIQARAVVVLGVVMDFLIQVILIDTGE